MESYCDAPEILASLPHIYFQDEKGNFVAKKVLRGFVGRGQGILKLEGINDMDTAITQKGRIGYAKREDLPLEEGASFIADLLGLPVIDADTGKIYGTVEEVSQMPSSDIYTVKAPKGPVLFPAVKEFLVRVDLEEGIFIRPIPGFFED